MSCTFLCPVCGFAARHLDPVVAVSFLNKHSLGALVDDEEYDRLCEEVLDEAQRIVT